MSENYTSLGRLAATSGVGFPALQRAAAEVPATLTMNGVPYFDAAAAQRLIDAARRGAETADHATAGTGHQSKNGGIGHHG